MNALNPFFWTDALNDPGQVLGRDEFARKVALRLKARTNVSLFGPRGTGKTSFSVKLMHELAKDHGGGAGPIDSIYINLQRATSIPAFISAVRHAISKHPNQRIRDIARAELSAVEKEFKINLGVVSGGLRSKDRTQEEDEQLLFAQLLVLRRLSDRIVIIFDEFQKLNKCPGSPLTIIRDALTGIEDEGVSMVFTGSIREALKMMLQNSDEPLYQQAVEMALPDIDAPDWFAFLRTSFEETGKPATDASINHILELTGGHPRRTQQLAWQVWEDTPIGEEITLLAVENAVDAALAIAGIRDQFDVLTAADENLGRMLDAIVSGQKPFSRPLLHLLGITGQSQATRSIEKLRNLGYIERVPGDRSLYRVSDPFFAEWLRRTSPFADDPTNLILLPLPELPE